MDTFLVPACLTLALTTISFAVQAWQWRTKAQDAERTNMQLGCDMARIARDTHDAAWSACRRHMLGLVYRVATKAEREGRDAFAALREVSHESEVVQVPSEV